MAAWDTKRTSMNNVATEISGKIAIVLNEIFDVTHDDILTYKFHNRNQNDRTRPGGSSVRIPRPLYPRKLPRHSPTHESAKGQ